MLNELLDQIETGINALGVLRAGFKTCAAGNAGFGYDFGLPIDKANGLDRTYPQALVAVLAVGLHGLNGIVHGIIASLTLLCRKMLLYWRDSGRKADRRSLRIRPPYSAPYRRSPQG